MTEAEYFNILGKMRTAEERRTFLRTLKDIKRAEEDTKKYSADIADLLAEMKSHAITCGNEK